MKSKRTSILLSAVLALWAVAASAGVSHPDVGLAHNRPVDWTAMRGKLKGALTNGLRFLGQDPHKQRDLLAEAVSVGRKPQLPGSPLDKSFHDLYFALAPAMKQLFDGHDLEENARALETFLGEPPHTIKAVLLGLRPQSGVVRPVILIERAVFVGKDGETSRVLAYEVGEDQEPKALSFGFPFFLSTGATLNFEAIPTDAGPVTFGQSQASVEDLQRFFEGALKKAGTRTVPEQGDSEATNETPSE